jgi:hypothetical protein
MNARKVDAADAAGRFARRRSPSRAFPRSPDLPGHHVLDIEQIVNQMRDVGDLSRDHVRPRRLIRQPRTAECR